MFFRMLVSQFAREAATRKMRDVVDEELLRRRTGVDSGEAPDEAQDSNAAPPQEIPPCDVLVVFALGVESCGLADRLEESTTLGGQSFREHAGRLGPQRVVVIEGGVGREAAARATDDAVALHQPAWVVSAGFAAGLRPELRRGHIVMADSLLDEQGGEWAVGFKIDPEVAASTAGLHVGRLLTVDRLVRTSEEKRRLGEQFDAVALDMETTAVAEVCRRHHLRMLSVRVISDAVDDQLPREIERLVRQKSLAGQLGAAAGAIIGRPSSVKDMWKLRDDAFQASERLANFLLGVLPQLQ
jgi:adenosylhomocysteine nucleosidase